MNVHLYANAEYIKARALFSRCQRGTSPFPITLLGSPPFPHILVFEKKKGLGLN